MRPNTLALEVHAHHGTGPSATPAGGPRVALVCMPWGSLETPSLAMALLKQYVIDAGCRPDLLYLNVRFAARIGAARYERLARAGFVTAEWFFAQRLFGAAGTGELTCDWPSMLANPEARRVITYITTNAGMTDEECERIAAVDVPWYIDECMRRIDWSQYALVGFTTTFAQSLATLLLAKRIKEAHPEVTIAIGGANVDSEMGVEMLRAFEWIDYIVHGEAEHSFPRLLANVAAGRFDERVPGVSMRKDGELLRGDTDQSPATDLDSIPTPDYSDYVAALDDAGLRAQVRFSLFFESSRGCWWGAKHHCTFCGLNGSTMGYRKKTAAKVYDEIVALASRYRCLRLDATDNILALEYFAELLPRLADLRIDLDLFYEVKANLRRDQIQLMAEAGIGRIQPGVESFNTRLLRLMRKGVTATQNIQMLKWCHEYGIHASYNVLYGFPQETAADYETLPTLCRMISHLRPPQFVTEVVFERFSPYFFDAARFKLQLQPWPEYGHIYPSSRVDLEKIAYFFSGQWEGQTSEPAAYIGPVRDEVTRWQERWAARAIYCYYEKGPDYLRIFDNRPRGDGIVKPRGFLLGAEMAAIYLFCDENRSFSSILTMMRERFGVQTTELRVRRWLDQLVAQWLLFREEDRYLALAVRTPPRHDSRSHRRASRSAATPAEPALAPA